MTNKLSKEAEQQVADMIAESIKPLKSELDLLKRDTEELHNRISTLSELLSDYYQLFSEYVRTEK